MHFLTSEAPSGSGKTRAATTFSCERIPRNSKFAIMQPTIRLCKQSRSDARKRYPSLKPEIRSIVSQPGMDEKVSHRITEYLNERDETGDLLFLTHAGFLRTDYWHRARDWHLFVDEAPDIGYHRKFRLKHHPTELTNLFRVLPCDSERYGVLEARDHGQLQLVLDRLQEDEIHEAFADLTSRLVSSHWNLYLDREKFAAFEGGDTYELEVHGLLHPSIFEQFATVTLMAANLRETIMYRYFEKLGCTFGEHGFINNNLLYREHPNGSRLKIKYLCDRKWSKTLRDQIVHKPDDEDDDTVSVGQLYLQLCQDEASKHSREAPLWIGNNDLGDDEFDGVRLSNVPHGMNNLQDHDVCCIMSALNPPQAHRVFLQEMCGMSERDIRRALLSQTAYQSCGRGILRNPNSTGTFLLIVPDRDTAEDIARYYPGCQIEGLITEYKVPRGRGRPPIYESDAARDDARREQNRLHSQRVRNKSLNIELSAYAGQTPDEARTSAVHILNDWAEIAPERNNIGAFAYSEWANTQDKHGLGDTTFQAMPDFIDELRRRQAITHGSKNANTLLSPTIFAHDVLPDNMTAAGIELNVTARAKDNAVVCRGFVLDMEHGVMTPDDFANLFPEMEFAAYSSWSHRPTAPRYRIAIPSTHYVPAAIHTLILQTIRRRIEAAGWGNKHAGGPKHGIDTGKLQEAAMFYWPCHRPHTFLIHQHDGREPLNPYEWFDLIPDHLLVATSPPGPTASASPHARFLSDDSKRSVSQATKYWREHGCVKGAGRTQQWLLSKRLRQAGCDDAEMRAIMWEQAGYATNPKERRSEIEALIADTALLAA